MRYTQKVVVNAVNLRQIDHCREGDEIEIGAVQIDIYKNEVQWHVVNLSQFLEVKGLLKYRHQYDVLYNLDIYEDDPRIVDFNTEIVSIYVTLDELMGKCKFNDKQNKILELYQMGNTEQDIAEIIKDTKQNVNGIIKTCVTKITEQSNHDWLYENVYWNKKRTNEKWKYCNKCEQWKPESNFGLHPQTLDGLQSNCKKCDNLRKNPCQEGTLDGIYVWEVNM